VRVSYGEGLASHSGPESCVFIRKGEGDALTGGAASRDLEPRKSHRERDALVAGKINLNKHNRIKFSVNANSGTGSGLADWAFTNIDLIYNPETGEFENTDIVGGFLAYEHNWSKTLASTIGIGYLDVDNKDFEGGLAFSSGYKPLINLFYRPLHEPLKGLVVGAEIEYAQRTNFDNSGSNTTRASILVYYDF
jgi:hypothetical protein